MEGERNGPAPNSNKTAKFACLLKLESFLVFPGTHTCRGSPELNVPHAVVPPAAGAQDAPGWSACEHRSPVDRGEGTEVGGGRARRTVL